MGDGFAMCCDGARCRVTVAMCLRCVCDVLHDCCIKVALVSRDCCDGALCRVTVAMVRCGV